VIKQNLSYVKSLEPHTLVKLTLNDIFVSIKDNLSHVWILGPHTFGKLLFYDIYLFLNKYQDRSKIMTNCSDWWLWVS